VVVHSVSIEGVPSSLGRLALAGPGLRRLVRAERPSAVVSVMDLPNLLALASLGLHRAGPRLIACVQIPPTIHYGASASGRVAVLPAIRRLYPRADLIVSLTEGVRADLDQLGRRIGSRTVVIHNACVDDQLLPGDAIDDVPAATRPVVLAAGRLTRQKGYPFLIDAFAEMRRRRDAELWVLGDGPDRPKIEEQARALGVQDDVKLLGFRSNPHAFMRRATVFALSSLYEGFGNVIVEAMAAGCPVVSTDCPYGPGEIITHRRDGLLVPVANAPALARALLEVLEDEILRSQIAAGGLSRARDFEAGVIADMYTEAIERVCHASGELAS
jgi:glycosyltransferase involved in cell wall biosynthesis